MASSPKFEEALALAEASTSPEAILEFDEEALTASAIFQDYATMEAHAALAACGKVLAPTPKAAAVQLALKYQRDPKTGKCKIEGCDTQLVSRRLKFLWPFKPFVDQQEKHHCRACKLKVCAAHFTRSEKGMKLCTLCFAKGVDGEDEGGDELDDMLEEEEAEALGGGAAAAAGGGSGKRASMGGRRASLGGRSGGASPAPSPAPAPQAAAATPPAKG